MDEFIRNLSLTRRNWRLDGVWIVNADGQDPICAVADVDQDYWVRAYPKTTLTAEEAELVSDATYDMRWRKSEIPVRSRLLEACGLS